MWQSSLQHSTYRKEPLPKAVDEAKCTAKVSLWKGLQSCSVLMLQIAQCPEYTTGRKLIPLKPLMFS